MMILKSKFPMFIVAGRGEAAAIENPVACRGFDHLIGHDVEINGEVRRCIGVERTPKTEHGAGEPIGLLFRPK